jgi:hypothetical protein
VAAGMLHFWKIVEEHLAELLVALKVEFIRVEG